MELIMNKQELEIAKKIAGIEGVHDKIIEAIKNQQRNHNHFLATTSTNSVSSPTVQSYESIYNPFDWSILGPLMLKYEVEPCYRYNEVAVWVESTWIKESFTDKSDIPRAMLECIIKSRENKLDELLKNKKNRWADGGEAMAGALAGM